jgi:MFS family permease
VLDRWRFVLVTVVVAGLTWAASELPVLTSGSGSAGGAPAWPLLAVGGAALGVVAGCLLGLAQAAVLPRNLRRRSAWVAGSALGWAAAMATIMLGASTAGEGWPLPTLLAWAGLTGAVAGGLLGLVLAWFVVSLDGQPLSTRVVLRALRAGRPRRLSRSVVGLRVTGRVSGSTYELPVMYVTHDDDLWVMVGGSAAKTWWRNVSRDTRVEVLRHGGWAPATADLVGPTDPPFLNGLAWYLTRWPRAKPAPDDPMVRLRSVHERHDSYAGSYGPAGSAGSRKPGTQR